MKKTVRLISIVSMLMLGATGCSVDESLTREGAIGGGTVDATLSDQQLTDDEINAVTKGTNFPDSLGNAIIYDQRKMLFTYQGSSGCPEHPESVHIEGSDLKIKFSEANKEMVCTTVITGPFTKVIDLPANFTRKSDIKVTAVIDNREVDIPVVVN